LHIKNWVLAILAPFALTAAAVAQTPDHVGSEICSECHVDAAEAWSGSHHALAWTTADPDNIEADFDGTSFTLGTMTARFRIEDGRHIVSVTETDGVTTEYPVHSVAGIAPLQQYLLETDPGRLQSFDVVWDVEEKRWYHLYPEETPPAEDGLHWTGPYKTWNARCAECHATNYARNYDAATRSYSSTQAEIGVGCEACHGPGSTHVAWAQGALEASQIPPELTPQGFSIAYDSAEAQIQQCATCHSRRGVLLNQSPVPGTPFHDAYTLSLLRPGLYHADGQIQDEVYVYGSFLQSKMYARGVQCSNCHEPHSATLKAEGNAVCTQCHSEAGNPDFPTLRKVAYDTEDHHFHDPDSAAGQCRSCHMIERDYMGIDGRRDHSFRIPRPDLGLRTESPDACTDCHADQGQGWAAAAIEAWYPDGAWTQPHYGEVLYAGRRDPAGAAGDLVTLARDDAMPGIVRATAAFLLQGAGDPAQADATAGLLSDPDPLVRAAAAALQRDAPPEIQAERLMPLLLDPMRSVRVAAARETISLPPEVLRPSVAAALIPAMNEWRAELRSTLDFPETHLRLGGIALTGRNFEAARAAFEEVVRLDPQRGDAWSMIVRLTDAMEGPEAARAALDRAIAAAPNDLGLQMLGNDLGP
jgi:predicted CXXCH cytochrome family protein